MVVLYVYINHLHICKILAHFKNSKVFIIKFNAYRNKVSVENLLSIFANS